MRDEMADCWKRDERIDAYVDGMLSDIERHELEMHLRSCERCRAEEQAIRSLVARARQLPQAFAPSTDRWEDVRARIRSSSPGPTSAQVRSSRRAMPWPVARLAAAILVTAALSSAATMLVLRGERGQPESAAFEPRVAAASLAEVERQYTDVTRDLSAELGARRAELSPEAVATVERSLAVIDAALAEARAALALEPDNPTLARMLSAAYEQKLDLLRRATQLSPSS